MKKRKIPDKKIQEVVLLKKYMNENNVIGLVSMEKMGAKSIQKLRKALRGKVVMRMCKKRLMKRALGEVDKPNITDLSNEIRGVSAMIFTNMNPLKLSKFLKDNSVKGPAKSGDIAPDDITVTAGDTRIPPGPIISDLNSILKLPTMIKDGTIHIREDTITHVQGDKIDIKQALLLGRLGVEPMTVTLDFYSAWENGVLIPEEVLKLDEEKILNDVRVAFAKAQALALSLGIITKETLKAFILKGVRAANILALELGIISSDTIPLFMSKAVQIATSMQSLIFGDSETTEDKKTEVADKKEEKKEEKDVGTGLGGLFD